MTAQPDAGAIIRVLADALPAPLTVTRIAALSGGASADTCAVDLADGDGATHELILRRAAGGNHFNPGVSKREEARAQQAAGAEGVPAAGVLAIFDDEMLGKGYLMRRLRGEAIPRKLLRDECHAPARARLADDCGRALAGIHRVQRNALPELQVLSPEQQVQQLATMHGAFAQPIPVFSLALRWLRGHLPKLTGPALVHGDFRTGNLLVDEQGLVAVLDWELVHFGNPLEDLGWLCAPAWRFGGEGPAGGFASREALVTAYEGAGGRPVDPAELRFWEIYATLRWGVICQFQAFAHLNRMAPSVELDLLLLIDGAL